MSELIQALTEMPENAEVVAYAPNGMALLVESVDIASDDGRVWACVGTEYTEKYD